MNNRVNPSSKLKIVIEPNQSLTSETQIKKKQLPQRNDDSINRRTKPIVDQKNNRRSSNEAPVASIDGPKQLLIKK